MCTEWIKYKEVCGSYVNGNFIHPYQNIVVKEVEPYSVFLCPEDFSTQKQMDIRMKHLSKKGFESFKECSARGKVCSRGDITPLRVLRREARGWRGHTSAGIPRQVPRSLLLWAGSAVPSALTLPLNSQESKATNFLLFNSSNIKKEKVAENGFGKLELKAEESKGLWGSFQFYCLTSYGHFSVLENSYCCIKG